MLRRSSLYSCSPHFEGASLHVFPHDGDSFSLADAKLGEYRIEGRPVLPGHFDDSINLVFVQFFNFCHVNETLDPLQSFPFVKEISIVWLKRDLRLSDHEPLFEAIREGFPVLLLFCYEPSLISAPQSDDRHWRFVWQSLEDLTTRLKAFQASIAIFHEEVKVVFERLARDFQIRAVYSHQETGIKVTFDRDVQMGLFFKEKEIQWKEYLQQGVGRGRKDRNG